LDEPGQCIFQLHARPARHARALLDAPPQLRPWGAWEFRLTDIDGNRLVFVQWVAGTVLGADVPRGLSSRPGASTRRSSRRLPFAGLASL
jgi:hypothetical protein